jgi:hypothetical protein
LAVKKLQQQIKKLTMKKLIIITILFFTSQLANAQLIDWTKIDLKGLLGKVMTVKQGWAPKFKVGNFDINKIAKVSEIINLKNVSTATKLFNTFKTGRTVYKAGSYVALATSLYSSVKNITASSKLDKATVATEIKKYSDQVKSAKGTLIAGGLTAITGVVVKLLTKKAASKAADAFNGAVKNKIKDIFSFDAPSANPYANAGIALKIKL